MKDEGKRAGKAKKRTKGGGAAKKGAKGGGAAKGKTAKKKTAKRKKRTKLDESKLKKFIDRRLIDALSHSVREHVLAVLNERIASPNEVAKEIGVDVNYISYHFRRLKKNGFIELVRVEPRRGFKEHFYRAKATFFIDDRESALLPTTLKPAIGVSLFQSIVDDLIRALRAGIFNARDGTHVSWTPLLVDEKGWCDAIAALCGALERVLAIRAESIERMARSGEEAIPMTIGIASFETPADPAPQEEVAAKG